MLDSDYSRSMIRRAASAEQVDDHFAANQWLAEAKAEKISRIEHYLQTRVLTSRPEGLMV